MPSEVESNDLRSNATPLQPGTLPMLGRTASATDVDWYALTVAEAGAYSISIRSLGTVYSRYHVTVVDAAGTLIDGFAQLTSDYTGQGGFAAPAAGTYYISVDDYQTGEGSYELTLAAAYGWNPYYFLDQNNHSMATAVAVQLNDAVAANIDIASNTTAVTDRDYFSVSMAANTVLSVNFAGSTDRDFNSFDVRILDAAGNTIASGSLGNPESLAASITTAGTYFVEVSGAPSHGFTGYSFVATSQPLSADWESEPNDDQAHADRLTPGEWTYARTFGLDWFVIDVTQAGRLFLQVLHDASTSTEPTLEILNAQGQVVDTTTLFISGLNTRDIAVDAGTYYVRINGHGTPAIDYALNAAFSAGPSSEPNNTMGTATAISLGRSTTGNTASLSDADWYRVELGSDARVFVTAVEGRSFASLTVSLVDAAGTVLHHTAGGEWIHFDTGIAAPGTYYVVVSGGPNFDAGTYRVLVTEAPDGVTRELEPNNTQAQAGEFTFGEAHTGYLPGNDVDWLHFRLDAAAVVTFGMQNAGLELLNAAGAHYGVFTPVWGEYITTANVGRLEAGDYYIRQSGPVGYPYTLTGTAIAATGLPNGAVTSAAPDDPVFAASTYLRAGATGINAQAAWADYTGEGIEIAFLGLGGIDYRNLDIGANYLASKSINVADGTPWVANSSFNSESTAAAVVAAGERDGAGTVGVAYNASVSALNTIYYAPSVAYLQQAMAQILDADVLADFTYGIPWSAGGQLDPLMEQITGTGRGGLGTIVVHSANLGFGDSAFDLSAADRHRVVVAATGADGKGSGNTGTSILVSAPGAVPTGDGLSTAGAVGVTAGVVALMLEANPDLGWRDVQEILAVSARVTDPANEGWYENAASDWNGGGRHFNQEYGYGLIDARAAVRLAESWTKQSVNSNQAMVQASASPSVGIPDGSDASPGAVSSSVTLSALEVEWVEIEVSIAHPYPVELAISLTGASGTFSIPMLTMPEYLMSGPGLTARFTLADFRGENAAGTWTLTVYDLAAFDVGTFNNWAIRAYGSAVSSDDAYVYTDEYGALAAGTASRRSLNDVNGGHDVVNVAALSASAVIDLNGGQSSIAGRALSIASGVIEDAYGGDGGDTLIGNGLANKLQGARGDDTLSGGNGADTLLGGAGNDWLDGGQGDVIDGGEGFDFVSFRSVAGRVGIQQVGGGVTQVTFADNSVMQVLNVEGFDAAGGISTAGSAGADQFTGGEGDDVITLGAGDDYLAGAGGNDTLLGGDGYDWLWAGNGDDELRGGAEKDNLSGEGGNDAVFGDAGNDRITGRDGNDSISAGDGDDWVGVWNDWGEDPARNYFPESGNDEISGDAGNDVLSAGLGTDTVHGGIGNDYLAGEQDDDLLFGGEGFDWLWAGAGADTLDGGAEKDNLNGESGNDLILAGDGNDRICGQQDDDEIHAGAGHDWVGVWNDWGEDPALNYFPEGGNDLIFGDAGNDVLSAGFGRDTVQGGADHDYVAGEQDDDQLFGNDGIDWLWGGSGADTMDGGTGDDHLIGESGIDLLTGGLGADIFEFRSMADIGDRILDFDAAEGDRIDVSELLNQQNYAGADPFADGRLSRVQSGTDVLFRFDGTLIATIGNTTLAGLNDSLFIV